MFWIIYFISIRAVFLLYHHRESQNLSGGEIFNVFRFGLRLDFSFAAYLSIIPFLLILINSITPRFKIALILKIYTFCFIIIISFLMIADLELYTAWGYRINSAVLQYFKTPKEMTASVSAAPVLLLSIIFILSTIVFIVLYLKKFNPIFKTNPAQNLTSVISSFIFLVALAVPGRGGFQQIPVNQSDVYFSNKIFANHAAVNLPWNFLHSVLRKDFNRNNPYVFMPDDKAKSILDSLYKNKPTGASNNILNTQQPNIIFIILESYTSKFIGCLGGEKGVTPNIDKIAAEGILFTNIYASGDRSEKGLVALLSGYPTQTITSIIKTPTKTEKLPQLSTVLKKQGYHTSYYYGGELAFANIKSYLLNGSYDRLISKSDFESKFYNSKWGVHDDILLRRFFSDLNKEKQPFFANLFTLSSHEPYEVPFAKRFPGNDETSLFKNSVAYTDQSIGDFVKQAKQQSWWDSTLLILVADHGHRLPNNDANDNPSKFKIPLIFTGGALKQNGLVINTIGSQTDIAYTLLKQLNINNADWNWSKDLLDSSANQFAFYIFNDGFGLVTPKDAITFDNVSKKEIYHSGEIDNNQLLMGKAYMQESFKDFLSR